MDRLRNRSPTAYSASGVHAVGGKTTKRYGICNTLRSHSSLRYLMPEALAAEDDWERSCGKAAPRSEVGMHDRGARHFEENSTH